jgi:hypothetical protein
MVWRRDGGPPTIEVPLPEGWGTARLIYPSSLPTQFEVSDGALRVELPQRAGRMFVLERSAAVFTA